MGYKSVCLFIVFCFKILFLVTGADVNTTQYCCDLGKNLATIGLKCTVFPTPIAGIADRDEAFCLTSIEACCKSLTRKLLCENGKQDAKANRNCIPSEDGMRYRKDCCEACKQGIQSSVTGQLADCQVSLGLGDIDDKTYSACCQETFPNSVFTTTPVPDTQLAPQAPAKREASSDGKEPNTLPSMQHLCDIGELCAQICIPTADSFKCECREGYILMDDKVSCKPISSPAVNRNSRKRPDRCDQNNPCEHRCIDTGVAIKCLCEDGYDLGSDKTSCKDIDECAIGEFECSPGEQCINAEGGYYCEYVDDSVTGDSLLGFEEPVICPEGYKFNGEKTTCDDIDECEFGIMCPRPKTCINTIGSFKCEGEDIPQCPPGFHYKAAIDTCADIDECITGENDCNKESQVCLNTKGNYTCVDRVSKCPAGFKKNPFTQTCEDIDECTENSEVCDANETCVNEPSGYKCVPNIVPVQPVTIPPTVNVPTVVNTLPTTATTTSTTTTQRPSQRPVCTRGYKYSVEHNQCVDIDECHEDRDICERTEICYNTPGSFLCECKPGYTKDFQTSACVDVNECQIGTHDCTIGHRCDNTVGSFICARITGCGTGYTLNYANGLCEDDDECSLGTHKCNDLGDQYKCKNTLGSYRCVPVEPPTQATTQRVTPLLPPTPITPRYPTPPAKKCQPGYVMNAVGDCQDEDECALGVHNCADLGPNFQCENVLGSYRCIPIRIEPVVPVTLAPTSTTHRMLVFVPRPVSDYPLISGQTKRCLPGYRMNALGNCEDINECDSNPCRPGQKCLNFNGRYQCISTLQCKYGFELNEAGDKCVDINECTRGTHKCAASQVCKNGEGYYICECPPGHHMPRGTRYCEDINECQTFYRVCPVQADCINTVGSYECRCKEGFKESGNNCVDTDECRETPGLCEHNCVNTWGSFRCACLPGFTLNSDNRTCQDVDECEKFSDRKLCIGTCLNVPGSYTCKCPQGYRLGDDGRTCKDVDECEQNVCPRTDEICLNTRGSYKCFTLTCPPNYYRDPSHKSRCKRMPSICDYTDLSCAVMPDQYTSHYISFASLLPVTHGPIKFFQIKGPQWVGSRVQFTMEIGDIQCPQGVERITERHFQMIESAQNSLQLAIVRPLEGPQEVQLVVKMFIYHSEIVTTRVVFYIYIVVSEYEF